MLNSKIAIALAAAIVLAALYGCSSSGTKSDDPVVVPDPPDYTAGFVTAVNTIADAEAASAAAADAAAGAATAAANLTAVTVVGDSATAVANAQAVLNAEDPANEAVTAAQKALDSATAALNDLAEDPNSENDDALRTALEDAIEIAEAERDAAQGSVDAINADIASVRGANEEDPLTPNDYGEAVAADIAGALAADSSAAGARTRGAHNPAGDVPEDAVLMGDRQGHTWEEIVGEANIVEGRISGTGGTVAVDSASLAGMPSSALGANGGTDNPPTVADGIEYDIGPTHMGIPGTAFCVGGCDVDGDGNLTGGWYFAPANGDTSYVGNATDGYTAEHYAEFGYWLTDDLTGTFVNTYSASAGATGTPLLFGGTDLEAEATYTGTAAGISAERTYDDDGAVASTASGAFTAKVELTATFGASDATLSGTVSDFEGPATDADWEVVFDEKTAIAAAFTDGATSTDGSAAGVWTANFYGETNQRPTGIIGGFNAHFKDGHAAGAYATQK